jgi:hypothetical protein
VACADLVELEGQLVSRYIGRMREQFNDSLNFFDLINVSKSQATSVTDVDHNAWDYMRRTRKDGSVKTPRKMVTRSNA